MLNHSVHRNSRVRVFVMPTLMLLTSSCCMPVTTGSDATKNMQQLLAPGTSSLASADANPCLRDGVCSADQDVISTYWRMDKEIH